MRGVASVDWVLTLVQVLLLEGRSACCPFVADTVPRRRVVWWIRWVVVHVLRLLLLLATATTLSVVGPFFTPRLADTRGVELRVMVRVAGLLMMMMMMLLLLCQRPDGPSRVCVFAMPVPTNPPLRRRVLLLLLLLLAGRRHLSLPRTTRRATVVVVHVEALSVVVVVVH